MDTNSQAEEVLSRITDDQDFFKALRTKEYSRLDTPVHQIYLDFTGGNLYPSSLIKKHHDALLNGVFGNPHSINPTSARSSILVESAREKVIEFFNAEEYLCVFTPNATGALKIVGECYPFTSDSHYVLLSDNHNSVNGIREFCKNHGGSVNYVPVQYEDLQINDEILKKALTDNAGQSNSLFSFPAQSNVSGVKHSLDWIKFAQNLGYDVLLDAAAFVPTSRLNLKEVQPEFVSISFYKIFGYPTGLGCLLIKKSVFDKLKKPWFAGGTVTMVSVTSQHSFLAGNHERFEDGTLNYLDIPALQNGLEFIESIGMERINARIKGLTQYLLDNLHALHHKNGKPLVKVFGPHDMEQRGGNLVMNFFDENGNTIDFESIDVVARDKNISIRSGCFCNPGIDEINNCITNDEMAQYFTSRDKGDYHDMVKYLGKMRGATRVSVGIATSKEDLDAFIEFLKEHFKI